MTHKYDDIIDLPHPTSSGHPPMSIYDRAAQFSPFSALVGYEDAIAESGRLTHEVGEYDGDEKELLDRKLRYLVDHPRSRISVTYFCPDERKAGGACFQREDIVVNVDPKDQLLITETMTIPMKYIRELCIMGVDM